MSSNFPISVRIASKTRYLETTGDSSYYYSNQLISNIALLKTLKKLGQQLSWPAKATDTASIAKQGTDFLAKANQSVRNSRIEPLINLMGTPGKEWVFANIKLVDKLANSKQFFNSKTIGLLAKGLGYSGRFNPVYLLNEGHLLNNSTNVLSENDKLWFKSFNSLAKISKYCTSKHYRPLSKRLTVLSSTTERLYKAAPEFKAKSQPKIFPNNKATALNRKSSLHNSKQQTSFLHKRLSVNNNSSSSHGKNKDLSLQKTSFSMAWTAFERNKENFYFTTVFKKKDRAFFVDDLQSATLINRQSLDKKNPFRKKAKNSVTTSLGLLPFYFTALGLVTHSQVIRSTLVIAPIISGSLQSNLLLADYKKTLKVTSSSGLGLVSTSPYCYIARTPKRTTLNFFFQIPAKLAEKRLYNRPQYHQVYILADLQGLQKSQKKNKPTYASVRLKL